MTMARAPKYLKPLKKTKDSQIVDKYKEVGPLKRTWVCEKCNFDIKRDSQIEEIDFCCQCRGKFIPTDKIEETLYDPHSEIRWISFLDSRKGDGKEQFMELQSFILEEEYNYDGGWIPLVEIEKHMKNQFTGFSRQRLLDLLDDMVQFRIVHKKKELDPLSKTPNKYRSYYRYSVDAVIRTKTDEGIKTEYFRLFSQNIDLSTELICAKNVLYRHGLMQEFEDDLKKWLEKKMIISLPSSPP